MQAKKTTSKDAAIEIRTDFAFDEASNGGSPLLGRGEEGLEGLLHDLVEQGLLGLVALVLDGAEIRPGPRVPKGSFASSGPTLDRFAGSTARLELKGRRPCPRVPARRVIASSQFTRSPV